MITPILSGTARVKFGVPLSGTKNGSNNVFTVPDSPDTCTLIVAGVCYFSPDDFTVSASTITILNSAAIPMAGDSAHLNYTY